MRESWDSYFLRIATEVASRATCDRAHVGCVLVRDKTILSTGYNGSVRGASHCDEVGHDMQDGHCVRTVHAESNAVAQAAREGARTAGATAYVTHLPCWPCFRLLLNAGIARVVYATAYRADDRVLQNAQRLGVEVVSLGESRLESAAPGGEAPVAAVFHKAWGACKNAPRYDKSVWLDAQATMETAGNRPRNPELRRLLIARISYFVESQGGTYDSKWEMCDATPASR